MPALALYSLQRYRLDYAPCNVMVKVSARAILSSFSSGMRHVNDDETSRVVTSLNWSDPSANTCTDSDG